ncbi:ubiquitin-protein ligase-like protein E3 [Paraphaeosphaeria sporulosa]|uniref:Ubiquitin-protein ligase-like protein E3 n=1 Tax=Paraphaeosphaeria sporulosa TaxID=1460663 RepID=A0A177CGB6_9PLEO|nr:ubiquitin-protein ligase-like protein E3 [Paraphaeosphaeria sporulosa]OAG06396.1 ubiquitin-protein ligase-like protein E3 [Paraphaeosphaeria sporulosa]
MEAAIRWSPHATQHLPRFLIIDVATNRLRLCQIEKYEKNKVKYKQLCLRDKLPNYTAFDWSKQDEAVVGIGSASGEATIVQIDPDRPQGEFIHSFPIRHQRKCNSIAFSSKNYVATGLDRVRNDVCLNIYDLNNPNVTSTSEPYKKLASSEAISSIKFFTNQPDTLVAGVSRQCIRLYDLRDSSTSGVAQYPTRQVHNIAIDPLDENYFISAGTTGDPTVTVWDQRYVKQRSNNDGAVLDFRPIVDNSHSATIWSLRYSGTKKGTFGVLANTGEFKIIELAQHSHHPEPDRSMKAGPHNQAWESQHYTKVSHNLRYPSYDARSGKQDLSRVVAYDFMSPGNPFAGPSALALHPNREIGILRIPPPAPRINVTALEEIYKDRTPIARPSPREGAVADDLIELQNQTLSDKLEVKPDPRDSLNGRLDRLNVETSHRSIPLESASHSSHQMHQDLLTLAYPTVKLPVDDLLKVLQTQKRRCQEGYNLDCRKNKDIVSNDPWLVDAWNLVERMEAHASNDGMAAKEGLDLAYLGVTDIWANELTMYDQRQVDPDAKTSEQVFTDTVVEICEKKEFPPFAGVATHHPDHRQLCLSLCGWNLSKRGLRERCGLLVDEGQYYKAIVLAVFQGYKDVALDILKETVQAKQIENIGLGAVIACNSVNEDQRHLCSWMADMTDEPYLKGLLAYFISGDWTTVVEMQQLSLPDRVGVALKYLPDDKLTHFLKLCTQETVAYGNIEGLLLTGLTTRAMDLFEHYIAKFGDLQSAVLILSRVCPLYIQDHRWGLWKEIYLNQMQVWRTFLERTRYIKEHNLKSVSRDGLPTSKPTSPSVSLRCHNCQQNLALRRDPRSSRSYLVPTTPSHHHQPSTSRPLRPPKPKGSTASPSLACPNCNAQMPRCGLCMMWLGSPDPSKVGSAQTLKEEDLEARLMVFCMSCTHGFHGHHARDWFARHAMCPVPDCQCMCGLLK